MGLYLSLQIFYVEEKVEKFVVSGDAQFDICYGPMATSVVSSFLINLVGMLTNMELFEFFICIS